jgi:hypothetical protein
MDDEIRFGVDYDRFDIAIAHYKFWVDVATIQQRFPKQLWKAIGCYFKLAEPGKGPLILSNEMQDEIYTQLCVKHFGGPMPIRVA